MTFKEIVDDTLERCDYGDPAQIGASTASRVRVKRHVNEAYRSVLRKSGMSRLTARASTQITTVIGTKTYTVTAPKIHSIYDDANNRLLTEKTLDDIRLFDPDGSITGNPEHYVLESAGATTILVRLWPTPASVLTLEVDDAAPTTALSADGDIPVVPVDFHDLLGMMARLKDYEKKADRRYRELKADIEGPDGKGGRIGELRLHLRKSKTLSTVPGRNRIRRGSKLGPFFESGT